MYREGPWLGRRFLRPAGGPEPGGAVTLPPEKRGTPAGPARGWVPLAPLGPLATVVALDLAGGRSFIVLGLTVISPLFAASLAGPAVTALYGALALGAAAGLGAWDGLYSGDGGAARPRRPSGSAGSWSAGCSRCGRVPGGSSASGG